jgi:hypothetical protein
MSIIEILVNWYSPLIYDIYFYDGYIDNESINNDDYESDDIDNVLINKLEVECKEKMECTK